MPTFNRLIARFKNPDGINKFRIKYPALTVNKLYYFNPETTIFDTLTPTEKNLYNTVLITAAPGGPNPPGGELLPQIYDQLTVSPLVVFVQYDQKYDPYAADLTGWWFNAIKYPTALANVPISNTIVAVVDTGIDQMHPDLNTNSLSASVNRRDFTTLKWPTTGAGNGPDYPDGVPLALGYDASDAVHGTHVAGIIGALSDGKYTVGTASAAKLMNLRAFDVNGATEASLAVALYYAIRNNARVINASWGSKILAINPKVGYTLKDVIAHACSKGAVVVCAAGNNGLPVTGYVPASFDNVISVGSIERVPGADPSQPVVYRRASSSNYGPNVIGAPGVNIASLKTMARGNQMLNYSGTSMATAFVSGLAARMLEKKPGLIAANSTNINTADVIRAKIIRTAISNDPQGYNIGLGMIDVHKTISQL